MNIHIGVTLFATSSLFHMALCKYFQNIVRKPVIKSFSSTAVKMGCDACETKPSLRSLKDTVKTYKRHVIISLGETQDAWPKAVENVTDSFAFRMNNALSAVRRKDFPIRLTACTYKSHEQMKNAVLLYPEGYIVNVPHDEVESFAEVVSKSTPLSSSDLSSFDHIKAPWKKIILCCVHGNRDQRCGQKGAEVYTNIKEELERRGLDKSEIAVFGSSHIGGHEFAGTLITYPSGNWYGYLTKEKVTALIDSILTDTILSGDCHRGIGCNNNQW
jgi:hypothetical protein